MPHLAGMVHEVAKVGFGREAEVYERSRPSYPPGALAWLREHHPDTRGREELRVPYLVDCYWSERT